MIRTMLVCLGLALCASAQAPAQAGTLCSLVADAADGRVLLEAGDCRTRVTPASTFKIPLAVMGFDSEVLKDAHAPVLPYKPGYVDWGGEAWRQPTDPTRWLKYSVVWYSQQVMHALGEARVTAYARQFGFGNADVTGDPGQGNGLDRAWIASSLLVSPVEEAAFLGRLVRHDLPVSRHAMDETEAVVEVTPAAGGWALHGKTGAAFPRKPGGGFDEAHGWGWYAGWAVKGGRTLVFVRLDRDEGAQATTPGVRARAEMVAEWPALAARLGAP